MEWFLNKTGDGSVILTFVGFDAKNNKTYSHVHFTPTEWAQFKKDVSKA